MQIIGRNSTISNSAISSGFDSVTEGLEQSTQKQGIASLDTAISTFANIDPNSTNILDQQPPISGPGDFPDPSTFMENQTNPDDVMKFINDPGFQPASELNDFSNIFFPGVRGKIQLPDQMKTLDDMHSTVFRLNEYQSQFDDHFQRFQLSGAAASPEDRSAEMERKQNPEPLQVEVLMKEAEPEPNDSIQFTPSAKASLGPILEGNADADIGKNTFIDVGGEAFFGAKASAEGKTEIGEYGSVTGSAGAYAGIGAKGDLDLGIKDGKLKFNIGGGFAFGPGVELGIGFDLNYEKIAEDLYNAGADVIDKVGDFFKGIGQEAKSVGETIEDTAEDVIETVEDTAEDVVDGLGDVVDGAGDVIDDVFDW